MKQFFKEIETYLSDIKQVQAHHVFFSDFRGQAFIVSAEFFTPNIDTDQFNLIKHELNLFILQTLEGLEIKVTPP
jgi:hypothetical protein